VEGLSKKKSGNFSPFILHFKYEFAGDSLGSFPDSERRHSLTQRGETIYSSEEHENSNTG
jgi:hypothetical protein